MKLQRKHLAQFFQAFILLLAIATQLTSLACAPACMAQTVPVRPEPEQSNAADSQNIAPSAVQTQNTVPNQYDDAIGNIYRVDQAAPQNQDKINNGVARILTGYYAPLVFQAAEQGQGAPMQQAAHNILNSGLGTVNDTYRGLHQWFSDDLVHNLFSNFWQLMGKWLTEFLGWIADAAQFLSKTLRVFVLNPNIAVNGLNGQGNDNISPLIRQGADLMYGIAIDVMLLFFIFSIWRYWADAAWSGSSNLMAPVGRLIFTAGLLLAWPTIYAFDIQISNEMIKAIESNPQDVMMMDYALAQAVKGGLITAGSAATMIFAPVVFSQAAQGTMAAEALAAGQAAENEAIAAGSTMAEALQQGEAAREAIRSAATRGKMSMGARGQMLVGDIFSFGATLVYTVLGLTLIVELMYILILKAVQTALLTAQYMFAPIFLVCYASPDTDGYTTGYVKSFVETSLWTFIWMGLFKVMAIVMFSNFNPWGKILLALGILQIMIQVPSFLGRAQISPASEFLSGKFAFGTVSKAIAGLKSHADDIFDPKKTEIPSFKSEKSSRQETGSDYNSKWNDDTWTNTGKTANAGGSASFKAITANGPGFKRGPDSRSGPPGDPNPIDFSPPTRNSTIEVPLLGKTKGPSSTGNQVQSKNLPFTNQTKASSKTSSLTAQIQASSLNRPLNAQNQASSLSQSANAQSQASSMNRKLTQAGRQFGSSSNANVYDWDESKTNWESAGRLHLSDTQTLASKLLSSKNRISGLHFGQPENSIRGNISSGVQSVKFAKNANEASIARTMCTAALIENVATDNNARLAARKAAIGSVAVDPARIGRIAGSARAAEAEARLQPAMFETAVLGAQAYLNGENGNEFTEYLLCRYGAWDEDKEVEAAYLLSNQDSQESKWNPGIGSASERLMACPIPKQLDACIAAENPAVKNMHPNRSKRAVKAALTYTYPRARTLFPDLQPARFRIKHGEMARALPALELNVASQIFDLSAHRDLNSMTPKMMETVVSRASSSNQSYAEAFQDLKTIAPKTAQDLHYIPPGQDLANIQFLSQLEAMICPKQLTETKASIMELVLHEANSTLSAPSLKR